MTDDTNRTRAPVHVGVLTQQIADERIARRAYEIYESRHRADGHADDDWFQAAAEYAAGLTSRPDRCDHSDPSDSFGYSRHGRGRTALLLAFV